MANLDALMVNVCTSVLVAESVTVTVKLAVPTPLALPLRMPVAGSMASPLGTSPAVTANL